MRRWIEGAYLVPKLPRVLAVGHEAPASESDLWEAVLYAGPNAALSHATAAHVRKLIEYPPREIHVSSPRDVRSLKNIHVHPRRTVARDIHAGLPVTTIPQTMLDLAATQEHKLVRKALARLDFNRVLDTQALRATCGKGKPGSKALLEALDIHDPRLAYTNGPLEYDFFEWCEHNKVPLPLVNVRVHGILVDAYWPAHSLVVELDGLGNHSTPAQLRRDKANDLTLRSAGLEIRRYDWALVHGHPKDVHADLMRALAR